MLAVKVFAEGVAEQIKAYLPPEYESVTCSVKEQNKTNGVLQVGIQADMPGHAASPIVYMESFYDEVRSGEPMDKIMGNIAEVIQDALDGPALDQSIRLEEFESIKDYLSVMVVNTAENRKLLEQVPHIVMLNQAAPDREKLAQLLNISNEQMGYITNADAGCGLIKYGSSLVPFVNQFPKNTKLYQLMTTKPGEDHANRNRQP